MTDNMDNLYEENYEKKLTLPKKILIGVFGVIAVIIAFNMFSSYNQTKKFKDKVDEFLVSWDSLIISQQQETQDMSDRISQDLDYKNLVSCMQEISEMYVDFDNKDEINEYLLDNTWREQYEKVMKYNAEHDNRKIEQEFIDFYTNNMEFHD